jgi:hypothetical protein
MCLQQDPQFFARQGLVLNDDGFHRGISDWGGFRIPSWKKGSRDLGRFVPGKKGAGGAQREA